MKLPRRTVKRGRVEIIPMIDTILILLIFYMSFSSFRKSEKRMDARLPIQGPDRIVDTSPPLVLHVQTTGAIIVNGNSYDPGLLRESLTSLGRTAPDTMMIIEADADTKYQSIIDVMDACAQAKLSRVSFRPLAATPES